jgi:hypothetical protein
MQEEASPTPAEPKRSLPRGVGKETPRWTGREPAEKQALD